MNYILEKKHFFKIGDKVYIEYWYKNIVTPVIIKEIKGRKFLISHNISESKLKNAPEELIKSSQIISKIN